MLTGFTFSARIKRVCIYHSGWCVYPIRAGQHLYPEWGSTSVPSEAVPLSRARQYLCPERGVLLHPERGVLPHPERGVLPHPERGVPVHPERGLLLHPARDLSPAAAPQNRFTVRASFHASFADRKTRADGTPLYHSNSVLCRPQVPDIDRKRFCAERDFTSAFK